MSKLLFSLFFTSALLLGFTSATYNLTCANLDYILNTLYLLTENSFLISSIPLRNYSIPSLVSAACSNINSFVELDSQSGNAAATSTSSLIDQTQGGTVANKVKRNRKSRTRGGRNNKQTAYSAIYSSFLEIDFDTDIDSSIDIDTDMNTAAAAATRRSTRRSQRSYERQFNTSTADVVNAIEFGIYFIYYYGDYSSYILSDSKTYCTNDLRAYFGGSNFPSLYEGAEDNPEDRSDWIDDSNTFYGNDAYATLNCTF